MGKQWKEKRCYFPVILAFVVAIGVLSGCSGKDDKTAEKLSATQIGKRIEQAVNLKDMKEEDRNKLKKLYKIDTDSVEDFILYTSTSNVRADELAVIKLTEQSQADSVKEKIKLRIDAQKIKFKDYRPNEYFLVENHVLKTKGPFVFFAVSKEVDQMEHAFDDAF
ncbi:hypothetical protein BVG16_12525 [Paenibacillus selenitireducens]|uniref:DUF4358 domain-containing protein n=1 Tax=Paenibacillus selenitireducens TaxID=1324314 RepID=A0A1T2XFL9_9BACL|nr:DUF4358 domain-containing protein [Paenibacillus selenitireducens]OPA78681.1 hypothetical protein BVG16_12525 [Paenibacillus selenitireducens]